MTPDQQLRIIAVESALRCGVQPNCQDVLESAAKIEDFLKGNNNTPIMAAPVPDENVQN